MKVELECRYGSQKSFNKKAMVETEGSRVHLYSYGTLVASTYGGKAEVYGDYSATTLKHIKEFLLQEGFTAINKKQIMKDYYVEG